VFYELNNIVQMIFKPYQKTKMCVMDVSNIFIYPLILVVNKTHNKTV